MKKNYLHPEMEVNPIAGISLMQAVSPSGPDDGPKVNEGIPTDDQW